MRKTITDEQIEKIKANEDNEEALKNFVGDNDFHMFLFAIPTGNGINFMSEAPSPDKMKKKCVLIIRARSKKELEGGGELDMSFIANEVIFSEINRQVLDSLHGICHDVYMPILGNPLNMIGWSDLVS
jgi:hypothetical protein